MSTTNTNQVSDIAVVTNGALEAKLQEQTGLNLDAPDDANLSTIVSDNNGDHVPNSACDGDIGINGGCPGNSQKEETKSFVPRQKRKKNKKKAKKRKHNTMQADSHNETSRDTVPTIAVDDKAKKKQPKEKVKEKPKPKPQLKPKPLDKNLEKTFNNLQPALQQVLLTKLLDPKYRKQVVGRISKGQAVQKTSPAVNDLNNMKADVPAVEEIEPGANTSQPEVREKQTEINPTKENEIEGNQEIEGNRQKEEEEIVAGDPTNAVDMYGRIETISLTSSIYGDNDEVASCSTTDSYPQECFDKLEVLFPIWSDTLTLIGSVQSDSGTISRHVFEYYKQEFQSKYETASARNTSVLEKINKADYRKLLKSGFYV